MDRNRGGRDERPAREERGGRERGGDDRGSSRGGGSRFEYKERSADQMNRRREQQSGGDFDSYFKPDTKVFKPAADDNTIRILPPTWEHADHYGFDIWVHYNVGPDEQSYLCPFKMKNEPCPICDERSEAIKDKDNDYADSLKPKQRVVIALIDRDNEKEGPMFWAMPWGVDKDLFMRIQDKRTGEVYSPDNPNEGYDVTFTKQGKGVTTKYIGLSLARRASPLGDSKWLDYIVANPIPEVLVYYSYDHVQAVFGGGGKRGPDRGDARGDPADDELKKVEQRGERQTQHRDDVDLTWTVVHAMTYEELCAVIDLHKLGNNIDPSKSKDDTELADWICEDLKITQATARRQVTSEATSSDKLAEMRSRRGS